MIGSTDQNQARDDYQLSEVARLDEVVRLMILKALAEGPPETVLERINFLVIQRLGKEAWSCIANAQRARRTAEGEVYEALISWEKRRIAEAESIAGAILEDGFDPHGFFVYILREAANCPPLYVGMSSNILGRLGNHLSDNSRRHRIHHVSLIRCKSKYAMEDTERRLIKEWKPELNIRGVA